MQVIGFNFTKISAERIKDKNPTNISTNIKFEDIVKEEILLLKDKSTLKISFDFQVDYEATLKKEEKENIAKLSFSGNIILTTEEEEFKIITKNWKKKEIQPDLKDALINLIIKKCTIRALDLEDQLNLPSHLPFPIAKTQVKENIK